MLKEGEDDMQVEEFKNKFAEIYKKAEMECYDYPIVFDEDEDGDIYLSSDGTFYFSDKCSNWINSTLGLKDYANIRMKKDYYILSTLLKFYRNLNSQYHSLL